MAMIDADKLIGVRLSDDSQKVTISLLGTDGETIELALPVIELPELVLYLSRAVARHHADQTGIPVLAYTLAVHEADVVNLANPASIGLVLTLREGLRVSFSVPRGMCAGLSELFSVAAAS
jgi:hypothetical protein